MARHGLSGVTDLGAIGHPGPEPWLPDTGAEEAVAKVTEQVQAARSQGPGLSLTAMHIQCT